MSEVSQQEQEMAATEQKEAVQEEAPEEEAPEEEAPAVNGDEERTAEMNGTAEGDETVESDAANEDEDDEDDESDSEDEEDSFTVKILEGKRERTSTARFVPEGKDPNELEKERKQRDEEEFVAGSGTRLGDIPFVEWSMNREDTKSEQVQLLHRLCFGMRAKGKHRVLTKRQLREFSGFPYSKEDQRYASRENVLKSQHKSVVLPLARLVGIECTSVTPVVELQQAIMDFLLCPQDSGKAVPEKKARGRVPKKKKVKRKSSTKKSSSEAPKKRKSSSKKSESEVVSSEEEEEDEKPEKVAKKKTPKKSAAASVAEPKKKVKTPKKSPAPTKKKTPVKRKASVSDASSSEDDQPLVKKKKEEPSDDEVKAVIKSILKSANLEEITMKSVCTQVYARYPDHDMQERKEFIKNTVKMIIS